jgi:hypothetical protein
MNGMRRVTTLTIVLGLSLLVFAAPVLAQDEGEEPVQISSDSEPAVTVTIPPPSDSTLDWTYRYLIPTALALAVLVILITSIQYFTQVVRKRYRTVEE